METTTINAKSRTAQFFTEFFAEFKSLLQFIVQVGIPTVIIFTVYLLLRATNPPATDFQDYLNHVTKFWNQHGFHFIQSFIVFMITVAVVKILSSIKKTGISEIHIKGSTFLFIVYILILIISVIGVMLAVTYAPILEVLKNGNISDNSEGIITGTIILSALITLLDTGKGLLFAILVTAAAAFVNGWLVDLYAFGILFIGPALGAIILKFIVTKTYDLVYDTKW